MAGKLDFVWSILQRTQEYYKLLAPLCHYFPIGSIDRFIAKNSRIPKDIDLIFFGKSTEFRLGIIEKLEKTGKVVRAFGKGFETGYLDNLVVKSLLDRSKIGLCLGFDDYRDTTSDVDFRFVSRTRLPQMLYQRVCVLSETVPLDNPYAAYMVSCPSGEIVNKACELLDGEAWLETGQAFCEKFFLEMDVGKICASPIEKRSRN
jgi:hypothetical protein